MLMLISAFQINRAKAKVSVPNFRTPNTLSLDHTPLRKPDSEKKFCTAPQKTDIKVIYIFEKMNLDTTE